MTPIGEDVGLPSGDGHIISIRGRMNPTAQQMRRVRRMVKHTASLVSTGGRIKECPGDNWMADFQRRIIFWRTTSSMPPFDVLTEDELLHLVVHEASHLNYSGKWHTPDDVNSDSFHRFVNAFEDIRIERLAEKDLPGFAPIRDDFNKKALVDWAKPRAFTVDLHDDEGNVVDSKVIQGKEADGLHAVDAIGILSIAHETGFPLFGKWHLQQFLLALWPKLTRVCNSQSTADLAEGILSVYREIMAADAEGRHPNPHMPTSDFDKLGNDEPTDEPIRSDPGDDEGDGECTSGDGDGSVAGDNVEKRINGMQRDAKAAETRAKLEQQRQHAREARGRADREARTAAGNEAGRGEHEPLPDATGEDAWNRTREEMRGDINTLMRKFQTVLRTNAEDDWLPGQRRGQLDASQAHRSLNGDMAIFRTREDVGALDYTFGLLIDVSSSQHSRAQQLLRATVLLAEACDKAELGLFVLPWSTTPLTMKHLHQRLSNMRGALGRHVSRPSGGTYEAPALVMAGEEFARVSSGHRMLINITDGETNGRQESISLITELQDFGVKVFGIGLEERLSLAGYYPNYTEVLDAAELVTLLPRLMNEMLRKGVK